MAVLSATALVYVHGVDTSTWREVWGMARPADAVWGGALGTGVGAWFGAVPIPLDWYVSSLSLSIKYKVINESCIGIVHGKRTLLPS